MRLTQRDLVEQTLLRTFDALKPLTLDHISLMDAYKDGSFGLSFLSMLLYANGYNKRGISTKYKYGLLYNSNNVVFGVGYFKKKKEDKFGHIHIVAPRGEKWFSEVDQFIRTIRKTSTIPQRTIYIRHLHEVQYKHLIKNGYSGIETDPWNLQAPSEDETYNSRFLSIKDILEHNDQNFSVKILRTKDSKNFRKKTRSAYLRFNNFLTRNGLNFELEVVTDKTRHYSEHIIKNFFYSLEKINGMTLSSAEDYLNIVKVKTPVKLNEKTFFPYLGFLRGKNVDLPVMFFSGENVGKNTVALYATFSTRDKNIIPNGIDTRGYTAISQYCYVRVLDKLFQNGIQHIDLGGSEEKSLDVFKRQLGAQNLSTYWAVCL